MRSKSSGVSAYTPWTAIAALLIIVGLCNFAKAQTSDAPNVEIMQKQLNLLTVFVAKDLPEYFGTLFANHEVRILKLEKLLEDCKCGKSSKTVEKSKPRVTGGVPNC